MARFYALIANGGRLVTPHVLVDVELPSSKGQPAKVLPGSPPAPAPESTGVDTGALDVIRQGLYEATHSGVGTSTAIFGSFPIPIAGKTGTAEKAIDLGGYKPLLDQSWWCGYGPADDARLVVCAVIENGGHGGTAAAPAAANVFEEFFHTTIANTTAVHSD